MNAVEKLAEVEAELRLKALGWERVTCPKCKGERYVQFGQYVPKCALCGGTGLAWEKKEK